MADPAPERGKIISIKALDRLKQALINEGVINTAQVKAVEDTAKKENEPLSKTLIKLGFVTSEQIAKLMGEQVNIPHVNIKNYIIDRRVLDLIPEKIARRYNIIPLFKIENVLTVAMADPQNIISIDEISAVAGCKVEPVIASEESIKVAIDQWYGVGDHRKDLIEELINEFVEISKKEEDEEKEEKPLTKGLAEIHLKIEADEAPIIKIVNSYIIQAMLEGASDIHMEPIYVGEIRDQETAEIAVRSALTGHLVLSTIHTNDAVGTIIRLSDIGIEAGLIASVLNCSFAQRLVRKNCPRCITEYKPDEKLLKRFGLSLEIKYQKGIGCDFCSGIGYRGRIGLFEILVVNKDMRRLIASKAYEDDIMKTARKQGLKTLLEDGLLKATNGITTLEEIMRVTLEET